MIFDKKQHHSIKNIVTKLGNKKLKKGSHGFVAGIQMTIMESAKSNSKIYTKQAKKSSAISLMTVVLAANRNYNRQVEKHVLFMRKNYSGLTFEKLEKWLSRKHDTAKKFSKIWGHNDENKYAILTALVKKIRGLDPDAKTTQDDFKVMKKWAKTSTLENWKDNCLVHQIKGVGIATFQHLRMTFGVDTVKPDQRVKQVLQREFPNFNFPKSEKFAILAVEEIAKIMAVSVLEIDQIFVKYGSGYY